MTRNADPYTVRRPEPASEPKPDGWMTVRDAADALGVAESTVRARVGRRELRARRNAEDVLEVYVQSEGE